MKKILSIFSIGVILGSGTILSGGGIACNNPTPPNPPAPKPTPSQLTLNNVSIININVALNQDHNGFVLNGVAAYKNVEEQIIDQYKVIFPKSKLSINNFESNSTSLTGKKTWAIQIYNINGKTAIENALNQALVFPPDYKTLKDNALNVKITTNDKNVVINSSKQNDTSLKQVEVEATLNKFIYTNKNANNNNAISVDTSKSATQNNLLQSKVIDFSSGVYNLGLSKESLNFDASANTLKNQIYNLTLKNKALLSKAIVSNLNTQLEDETKKLNQLGELKIAQNDVPQNEAITLNNSDVNFL